MEKTEKEGNDWSIPDENENIQVPDKLATLFNKVATQLRFHTISGKNEVITVAHIVQHAEEYASMKTEGLRWENKCHITNIEQLHKENAELKVENERLRTLINSPELEQFLDGVKIEAAHQTERWGLENEESNPPHHYSLVLAKLGGKFAVTIFERDVEKFKHHCITIAAVMHNVHRQVKKKGTIVHQWFGTKA